MTGVIMKNEVEYVWWRSERERVDECGIYDIDAVNNGEWKIILLVITEIQRNQ